MQTERDFVREIYPDMQCPHCGTWLNWGSLKDLGSAYTYDDWYCGGCRMSVRELIYGKQVVSESLNPNTYDKENN